MNEFIPDKTYPAPLNGLQTLDFDPSHPLVKQAKDIFTDTFPFFHNQFQYEFENNDFLQAYVIGGTVVATAFCSDQVVDAKKHLYIQWIARNRSEYFRGTGSLLLSGIESFARKNKYDAISAHVGSFSVGAHLMFRKANFVRLGETSNHYGKNLHKLEAPVSYIAPPSQTASYIRLSPRAVNYVRSRNKQ